MKEETECSRIIVNDGKVGGDSKLNSGEKSRDKKEWGWNFCNTTLHS